MTRLGSGTSWTLPGAPVQFDFPDAGASPASSQLSYPPCLECRREGRACECSRHRENEAQKDQTSPGGWRHHKAHFAYLCLDLSIEKKKPLFGEVPIIVFLSMQLNIIPN